jgi:hypothetical protein
MNNGLAITVMEIKFIVGNVGTIGPFGISIATSSPQVSELARVQYSAQQLVAERARLSERSSVEAERRSTRTS